jgi:AcrR family transcriptional regulator
MTITTDLDYGPVMDLDRSGPQSGSSTGPLTPDADPSSPSLLMGAAPARRERADAARNRLRVLAAAESLFAEQGVSGTTMDQVAARAGVGKGTLYRRFGDQAGLAAELLSERGRELQERMMSGPPPLGPGAGPGERLAAFAQAYLTFQAGHLDLVLLSESGPAGSRVRKGSYGFWRQHCAWLLSRAGAPDPSIRAEALLAALSAEQVRHWLGDGGHGLDELAGAVARLSESLARPTPPPA